MLLWFKNHGRKTAVFNSKNLGVGNYHLCFLNKKVIAGILRTVLFELRELATEWTTSAQQNYSC
jgi:hypothetical protein